MSARRRILLAVCAGLLGLLTLYVRRAGPRPTTRIETEAVDASGFLAGRVLHADGRPAHGAEVNAAGQSDNALAVTGTDGAFLIDVKSGEQRLLAQLGDEAGAMPSAVSVKPGTLVDGIIIRLAPAASFEGKVVSDTGAAIAGAIVTASIALAAYARSDIHQGAVVGAATTDENGHFNIGRLGRAVFAVQASAKGFLAAAPARSAAAYCSASFHVPSAQFRC